MTLDQKVRYLPKYMFSLYSFVEKEFDNLSINEIQSIYKEIFFRASEYKVLMTVKIERVMKPYFAIFTTEKELIEVYNNIPEASKLGEISIFLLTNYLKNRRNFKDLKFKLITHSELFNIIYNKINKN